VQRQYLGCVGKTANGIVTVHVGLAVGRALNVRCAIRFRRQRRVSE
jgi:hypothetical protein